MPLKIDAAVYSHIGNVRKNNEDNFYFNGLFMDENQRNTGGRFARVSADNIQVYAVCDGMGGEEGGEDASITAVRALAQYAKNERKMDDAEYIKDSLQNISDTIEANARKKGFHSGTTIAMLMIHHHMARIVHVGDSRVYCLENQKLSRRTVDHSEVQRLYAMGLIHKEEIATHPKRHMINQFLGMSRTDGLISPSISDPEPLIPGNRYLICSDGLTDMVNDTEIAQIISQSASAEEAVKELTIAALNKGGRDNVTTICLFVENADAKSGPLLKKYKREQKISIAGIVVSALIILFSFAMMLKDLLL